MSMMPVPQLTAAQQREQLDANPIGGVGTALLVGAGALVLYLLFAKRSEARVVVPAGTSPFTTTCPIDLQKIDRWGQSRGFPVVYFPRATTPPTFEELESSPQSAAFQNLPDSAQVVVVIGDSSFWYYIAEGEQTGRADNLRSDYCSFPNTEPPIEPPPPPTAVPPSTAGLSALPRSEAWEYSARQYFFWNARRQTWDFIGTHVEPCIGPAGAACLGTTGTIYSDIDAFLGGASLYESSWLAEVAWVWTPWSWHSYGTQVDPPYQRLVEGSR
jgi:hypothetical protein